MQKLLNRLKFGGKVDTWATEETVRFWW